jgi:2-polyprenyl-3-methyl-5-hydroxy-6-metoxy-1,4-benzoquinol methylase
MQIEHILGFVRRALSKMVIGPLKYGKRGGYDAHKYWHDRFSKYGHSLRGVGHEGLSEAENKKMYSEAAGIFTNVCRAERIDLQSVNALEIGSGSGFYAQLLHELGVKNYTGVDITDVLFPELRKKFPRFTFVRKDICSDRIEGRFDLLVMIDVIEHIMTEDDLSFCMKNVRTCLADNGIFIVAPIMTTSKKSLFYVRSWALGDVQELFPGYVFREPVPFRSGNILIIRTPKS